MAETGSGWALDLSSFRRFFQLLVLMRKTS